MASVDGAKSSADAGVGLRLHQDEASALAVPAANGGRLHRCQRGNITTIVLFMGLVFYALTAMTWNTGLVASAKVEAQTAADSAAYTSAVWTSRAVNVIAATNMVALREAAGFGMALQMTGGSLITSYYWLKAIKKAMGYIKTIILAPIGIVMLIKIIIEIIAGVLMVFVEDAKYPWDWIKTLINAPTRLGAIIDYQEAVVASVPLAIQTDVAALETYYDCKISLYDGNSVPKPGADEATGIVAPLKAGDLLTGVVPVTLRFLNDALFQGDAWGKQEPIKSTMQTFGKSSSNYKKMLFFSTLGAVAVMGLVRGPYTLKTTTAILELGAYESGFEDYTVIAVAEKNNDNQGSKQYPRTPVNYMAPGLFSSDPLLPVAYAQAETTNGIEGLIGQLPVIGAISTVYPWKVWTQWGWQWEPRLTRSGQTPGVTLKESVFEATRVGAGVSAVGDLGDVLAH